MFFGHSRAQILDIQISFVLDLVVQLAELAVSLEAGLGPVDIDFGFASENVVVLEELVGFLGLVGLGEADEGELLLDLGVLLDKNAGDLDKGGTVPKSFNF